MAQTIERRRAYRREEKWKAYMRNYRRNNPLRFKGYELKHNYGLSLADYNILLRKQENRCAICKSLTPLCVDHNHTTGKIRGLLCNNCNRVLGLLKDNTQILISATEYLLKQNTI